MAPVYVAQREPFFPLQNWFEASASPEVLSTVEPELRHDVSLRNTETPPSNAKLRSVLSMLTLSDTVIRPGLLFQVNPCWPFLYAMLRRMTWFTAIFEPPSLKPLRSPFASWVPSDRVPLE